MPLGGTDRRDSPLHGARGLRPLRPEGRDGTPPRGVCAGPPRGAAAHARRQLPGGGAADVRPRAAPRARDNPTGDPRGRARRATGRGCRGARGGHVHAATRGAGVSPAGRARGAGAGDTGERPPARRGDENVTRVGT